MSRHEDGPHVVVPAPGPGEAVGPSPAAAALELTGGVVVAALARLAAADTRADVAAAVPALMVEERGVRGCAVVVRDGGQVVVLGSAGYECGTMSPGATLPLDAGLPVTEAVRSGRPVERGAGPAWVAVPFGARRAAGALLLSLVGPPSPRPRDREALETLARAVGGALGRASAQESAFVDLALVTATLAPPPAVPGRGVAIRRLPLDGVVGADVAVRVDTGGATWLVAADVHRRGLEAAVLARTVHATVTAVVPHVREPLAVVDAVRAALAGSGPGRAAGVCVARLEDGEVRVAMAGAPPPLVLTGGRVLPVTVDEHGTAALRPPDDAVLVLHSDGLTARAGGTLSVADLVGDVPDDLDVLADALVRSAGRAGPASDDVAVVVARPARLP